MTELVAYLVPGIALGSSFALIGSGFVVVHRVTRVVNFAQGSIAVRRRRCCPRRCWPAGCRTWLGEALTVVICGVVGRAGRPARRRQPRHPAADLADRHPRRLDADLGGHHLALGPGPGVAAGPERFRDDPRRQVERQRLLVARRDSGGLRGAGALLLPDLRRQGAHRERVEPVRRPDGRHRRTPDGAGGVRPLRGARRTGRGADRAEQRRVVLLRPADGARAGSRPPSSAGWSARCAPWSAGSASAWPAS